MSQTRDQKRFTISEVVADWQELMIRQCTMHRHANHSAFGGIIPHFRRFSTILRGICEIPLFHSIHLSHKNLVFSYINL